MEYKGSLEFTFQEQEEDYVIAKMPITEGCKNPYGVVAAGATLWFADACASVLAMGGSKFEIGMKGFPLAINLNANLLSNQTEGSFTAKSIFVKQGKTISVVRTTVTGSNGSVIADVTTSHVLSK